MFLKVLKAVHRSHGPLEHHMNFQTKLLTADDLHAKGSHLCQFVCGKAKQISAEFEGALLADLEWTDDLLIYDDKLKSDYLALAVLLNLHHAAAYERRVIMPLNKLSP